MTNNTVGRVVFNRKDGDVSVDGTAPPSCANDPVQRPSHYTKGKIEVIDFLIDQDLPFMAANALKYICRFRYKGNPIEDLKKAVWYLNKQIDVLEKERTDPRCDWFKVGKDDLCPCEYDPTFTGPCGCDKEEP